VEIFCKNLALEEVICKVEKWFMSSINFPDLPQHFNPFRRLFDLLKEEVICGNALKNKRNKSKFYSYTTSECSESFVLELIDRDLSVYCMTGFGLGIKVDDFISVGKMNSTTYQVVNIDYYLDPSDTWIALLQECNH
jgi:hypothetical protein